MNRLLCALALLLGLGVEPASAADPWSPATVVSSQSDLPVDVVVDDYGRATAFVREDRDPDILYAVRRGADGTWGAKVRVAPIQREWGTDAVADAAGRITVVYTTGNASEYYVAASVYVPRVGWSHRRLSPVGVNATDPRIAMNATGRTLIAWTTYAKDWSTQQVQSIIDAGGGDWRPVRTHAQGVSAYAHDVAVDEDGRMALAAWTGKAISVQRRSVGGTWSAWYHQADSANEARIGLADGDLTLIFWRTTGEDYYGDPLHSAFARLRRADGSWTSATRVTNAGDVDVAVGPDGRAAIAYVTEGVKVRERRADGSWATPATVIGGQVSGSDEPALEMDGRGVLHLAARTPTYSTIAYGRRVPGQPWAVVEVAGQGTGDGDGQPFGVSRKGYVAAIWNGSWATVDGRVRTP